MAARGGARPVKPARRRPSSTMVAVGAVLLAAVTAVVFLLSAARHRAPTAAPPRPSAPAASTAAPSASPTLGPFGHIATRTADPVPITVAQMFPDTFTVNGVAFLRTTSKPGTNCPASVIGAALQSAFPGKTCTQVLRASYLATASKAMGTIGVLNLSTAGTAVQAGKAADAGDFIAQLKGPSGPTKTLGQGTGLEEAATKGHYLILIWAQFTNGAPPKSPGQQAQLKAFMNDLFLNTANISLSNRMVNGTP
jgi:hypothetical protein